MKKRVAVLASLLILTFITGIFPDVPVFADETPAAVIYHTGDTDGFLSTSDETIGADILSSIVEISRERVPETFLFDTGDAFQGSFFVNMDKGDNAVTVMNAVGYDAMTPGNHDFDYGIDRMIELAGKASFPILIQESAAVGNAPITSSSLIERGDITIGVFGITTPAVKYNSVGGFGLDLMTMPELIAYASDTAASLRNDGADIVVCLSHIGSVDNEVRNIGTVYDIADGAEGIDVIIDGNTHDENLNRKTEGKIPVAIAGERGEDIGVVEFYMDEATGLYTPKISLVKKSQTLNVVPDATVAGVLVACKENADFKSKEVVAISDVTLTDFEKEIIRGGESVIADMVADSMRWAAESDIALINAGVIRGPIYQGKVTYGTISNVLPYSNIIYVAEVKGSVIREALEYSASLFGQSDGGFMQVSGLSYAFDPEKPVGNRLTEVLVGKRQLDDEETYSVATLDFLTEGGDGYEMFVPAFTDSYAVGSGDLAAVFAEYLNSGESPLTTTQNRIRVEPGSEMKPFSFTPIIIISSVSFAAILILIVSVRKPKPRVKRE
ncbi:MAG: bifunctional metallophosphatase/5'-nucleotidase [Ruminococcus sp.]|nr:bifunctional metallophosphatase/5'-nucleotidase [Ruminococcus sp.]